MPSLDSNDTCPHGLLTDKKARLAKRWDKIAVRARDVDWGKDCLGSMASRLGLPWYRGRGEEPLSRFLVYEGSSLVALRGFGFQKIGRLCDIVELALDAPPPADDSEELSYSDPREALVDWSVPPDFPCYLIRLPVRLANYCERQCIAKLGQLLVEWETLGFGGFKAQQNLGSKSVRRLEFFVDSLRIKDHKTASLFLPLDPTGAGLSLGRALALIAMDPKPSERLLLNRRLIERMTLEVSAEDSGLTRERVRQVEANFLNEVRHVLEYFREDCARLLDAWIGISDWEHQIQQLDLHDNENFIAAVLDAVFRDTPQAVARALGEESRMDNWHEELVSHPELWFGGVKLSDFLSIRVTIDQQQCFCEHVAASCILQLDHVEGRVHPARTGIRQTVEAMIAGEEDPMPLTWLVQLLRRTGYHPLVSPRVLLRQRQRWLRDYDFPTNMILWDE